MSVKITELWVYAHWTAAEKCRTLVNVCTDFYSHLSSSSAWVLINLIGQNKSFTIAIEIS